MDYELLGLLLDFEPRWRELLLKRLLSLGILSLLSEVFRRDELLLLEVDEVTDAMSLDESGMATLLSVVFVEGELQIAHNDGGGGDGGGGVKTE